jgi:hypothetical protein
MKGIYHEGPRIRYFGYRRDPDPEGMSWREITSEPERDLIDEHSLHDLAWDGARVVLRSQVERDRRTADRETRGYEDRIRGDLIIQEILREIGLPPAELLRRIRER